MKIGIHQPNFLPWIGYFQKALACDTFVLFNDVQYPRGKSYSNRVKIKMGQDTGWITVPVKGKGDKNDYMNTQIDYSQNWQRKVLMTLKGNYGKTPFFDEFFPILENAMHSDFESIGALNIFLIKEVMNYLKSGTEMVLSSDLDIDSTGTHKILDICLKLQATEYYSGSGSGSARYIEEELFEHNGISVLWQDVSHVSYKQSDESFTPGLSIVDLLFYHGENSGSYLIK